MKRIKIFVMASMFLFCCMTVTQNGEAFQDNSADRIEQAQAYKPRQIVDLQRCRQNRYLPHYPYQGPYQKRNRPDRFYQNTVPPVIIPPVVVNPNTYDTSLTYVCRNGITFCYTPYPGYAGQSCQCLGPYGTLLFGIFSQY